MFVQRFQLRCIPAPTNRAYHRWQTALLVVLIAQEDRRAALLEMKRLMRMHRWQIAETLQCATLIEERVRASGGKLWEAYEVARQRGYWIEIFPDHFASGRDGLPPVLPPPFDEEFIDRVVARAGGRRLTMAERNQDRTRNVDYRLDQCLVELKDIQEEGLEKPERQQKLAALFCPYFPGETEVLIDPAVLSPDDLYVYADLISGPLRVALKSASDQIKATKVHLGEPSLSGGVIVLNTGYYSLAPAQFQQLAVAHAQASRHIEWTVCISMEFSTDGFSTHMMTEFYPPTGGPAVVQRLASAFELEQEVFMNAWPGRLGTSPEKRTVPAPVVFEIDGVTYRYFPRCLAPRWTPESMHRS